MNITLTGFGIKKTIAYRGPAIFKTTEINVEELVSDASKGAEYYYNTPACMSGITYALTQILSGRPYIKKNMPQASRILESLIDLN